MSTGITAWEILRAVAKSAGLSRQQLLGPDRTRPTARARQVACVLIRDKRPALTWAQIGRIMHKDRTTVMHACKILPAVIHREPETKALYHRAKRRLGV